MGVQHQVAYTIDLGQKVCQAKLGAFRYSIFSLNELIFAFLTLFQGKKG